MFGWTFGNIFMPGSALGESPSPAMVGRAGQWTSGGGPSVMARSSADMT